jgi:GTP-binding protein EngB required for normal cell division
VVGLSDVGVIRNIRCNEADPTCAGTSSNCPGRRRENAMSIDNLEEHGPRLNEYQQRHLLVSCQYIDKLLGEVEQIANVPSGETLFPGHISTMTPMQRKVLQDYVSRIRSRLLAVLDSEHLRPPAPYGQDVFSIRMTLTFVDIAIEELRPKYMRGYGAVPEALIPRIEGTVDELRTIVQKLSEYVAEDPGHDLQARLDRLEQGRDDVHSLKVLERIITERGLVEYRPRLAMLVDRASSRAFEIAVFGRVSSGKSSLLNYILESPVLPVGVTPITAVPTRITHGDEPRLRVSFADRPDVTPPLDRLPEFVTEQLNPGNALHVQRLVVELPARRLRDGVVFVDTPGLGSLARGGAEQTLAYLPRCDLGAVLVDAGSTLTPDDLLTVQALYDAAVPTTVLLSKADLLAPEERLRAAAYTAERLRQELGVEVSIHPVSVMPGHADLLERWFAGEIEPLYARHQEAVNLSLRRKIAALREAVQVSLRVRLDRRQPSSPPAPGAIDEAETELRRVAGLFVSTEHRCETLASGLGRRGPEVLRQTALRLRRDAGRTAADPQAAADEFATSLREVVGADIEEIRERVADLTSTCAKALEQAATALRTRTDPLHPTTDELPPLALTLAGFVAPRARLLAFSKRLEVAYLEWHLRQHVGDRLDQALAAHATLVASWTRRSVGAVRAAFEEHAEPLRSAFAEVRRPETGPLEGEGAQGVEHDLGELERLEQPAAPTGVSL